MSANPDFIYQPPMSPYLDIIYQDDSIVVLNKNSGLLTVPGRLPEHQDCLQQRVCRVLPTARIVHRLDMATSGIIIMALNKNSQAALGKQFEQRKTQKTYIARVFGQITENTGSIDLPLICDWPNRPKQMVDYERGKSALTHFKVISRNADSSLVQLTPVTGRSHQLRVHMMSIGHPILGDRLYAHAQALTISNRLQLHAQSLTLYHPISGELITFNCDCPFD